MTDPGQAVVVLVSGPDRDALSRIGRALIEERLIACLNIVDAVTSIYRWEGAICEEAEALGIMKTTVGCVPVLRDRVLELHPYDVPELVVLPITDGSTSYLDWVRSEVS